MNRCNFTLTLLCCCLSFAGIGQKNTAACKDAHDGIFYNYPKNSTSTIRFERFGEYQKETNLTTGDTAIWTVKWKSDCVYSLEYVKGNYKESEETGALLKQRKAKLLAKIDRVGEDYYTYSLYFIRTSNLPFSSDTMWFSEKMNIIQGKTAQLVTSEKELRRPRFNDTSFALVYVYRIGKFTNSLANYPIYLDGIAIDIMKNKSGYIYKIPKEGKYSFGSKLMDHTSSIDINIKPGHRYYIKSMIHWGLHRTRNFNLEMKLMPEDIGENEFETIIWNK